MIAFGSLAKKFQAAARLSRTRVARRRGMKRAVVAVARRIGAILNGMRADGAAFRLARQDGPSVVA